MKRYLTGLSVLTLSAFLISGCGGTKQRVKASDVKTTGDEVVEADGVAPYSAGDLAGSKAGSLAAAQRAAVELVVGVYVNAHTQVDKAVTIDNKILARTKGYIKKYEIIREGREGEWYKTRIRALVSTRDLKEDLDDAGLLKHFGAGNPRAAVFVQEWIGEKENKDGNVARVVTDRLLKQGFRIMELPKYVRDDSDPIEAAKGMSRGVAEVLVSGVARAQALEFGRKEMGNMNTYRAAVTLRAIEIGTGEVLATVSEVASGIEGTPEIAGGKALSNAAELAMKGLRTLADEVNKRSHVTVSVIGLKSFEVLSRFQKELVKVKGVRELNLRSYDQMEGKVSMDVVTEAITEQELAQEAIRIGGATWSVYQVSTRSVQLNASLAGRE